jgi:hypothetical protein
MIGLQDGRLSNCGRIPGRGKKCFSSPKGLDSSRDLLPSGFATEGMAFAFITYTRVLYILLIPLFLFYCISTL